MVEIDGCEVCGSKDLQSVLDLGAQPLCDDLIPIGSDAVCAEYPIEILYCNVCRTAHQRFQVPKRELFQDSYHYRARMTGSVLAGMKDLVESCEKRVGTLAGKVVLDIGCNDGSLLNYFEDKGARTIGVEPTGAAADSRHQTINEFFDRQSAEKVLELVGQPDLITFTNVFAHIEDLPGLIDNLKILIGPNTWIAIENHYLGAVLEYGQFDTFYHEHPRTYSLTSFNFIAKDLGLNLCDAEFVSRYGGNIRAFMGPAGEGVPIKDEAAFGEQFAVMDREMQDWVAGTKSRIDALVAEHGPLRAKAFPGRVAILMKLLGVDKDQIEGVYEIKGSRKTGNYVPGTHIPIYPEKDLYESGDLDSPILNLAWHIPAEVRANLASNGYRGKVIDIRDFRRIL